MILSEYQTTIPERFYGEKMMSGNEKKPEYVRVASGWCVPKAGEGKVPKVFKIGLLEPDPEREGKSRIIEDSTMIVFLKDLDALRNGTSRFRSVNLYKDNPLPNRT